VSEGRPSYLKARWRASEDTMENLIGIGEFWGGAFGFFGGLGVFFLGVGFLWWVSLQARRK